MATLHEVTDLTKKVLLWGGITVVIIILAIFLLRATGFFKNIFFPSPKPPPTVTFGKLPPIHFPESSVPQKKFTYIVNTLTGELPTFDDRIPVYEIAYPQSSLLALQRARDRVKQIGFISPGIALSPVLYQWTDQVLPNRKLLLNIQTFNFSLTSDYLSNPDVLVSNNLPSDVEAKNIVQGVLKALAAVPDDLDPEKTTATFYNVVNNQLLPETSLSNAKVIRVDLFQKDFNTYPIVYPHPPFSPMHFYVGGGEREAQVVASEFYHYTIASPSAQPESTYPIKTSQEAYDELAKGDGYLAQYKGTGDSISIQDVRLGYYIGKDDPEYLMPIYIFEGSGDFIAYVSAVRKEQIADE